MRGGPRPHPSPTAVPEVIQVVLAEHARILRLFAALEDLPCGSACERAALGRAWRRLADLVEVHAAAEEEISYQKVLGRTGPIAALVETAIADHDDIREAVAEARLAEPGSACWWRAVASAHRACAEHFASEEEGLLTAVGAFLTPDVGKLLARQWAAFVAAQRPGPSHQTGSPHRSADSQFRSGGSGI